MYGLSCSQFDSRFQGLGRVQESPYMGDNGHLVIDYKEGGVCNNRGKQWSTSIIFTCDKSETLEAEHPLGRPEHVSTDMDKCRTVFKFPTVLACNDTTTDQIVELDSCKGHICLVTTSTNSSKSLGLLSDFMYEPNL